MLFCLVSRSQVVALKRTIKQVDPNAFMYSVNVTEAIGMGFDKLDKDNSEKKEKNIKKNKKQNINKPKAELAQVENTNPPETFAKGNNEIDN